jgi:siroheme synthase
MAGGMPADTPAAAIGRATTNEQTVVRCRIDELADTHVESPATLVIGAVAALNVGDLAALAAYAVDSC